MSETPKKHLEDIGITSQDLGVDLIAKKDNEYHAIQCKYHGDKNQNITYKEVSTFLQQVESNKRITMGYICSSANGTSKNYQKVQKKEIQETPVCAVSVRRSSSSAWANGSSSQPSGGAPLGRAPLRGRCPGASLPLSAETGGAPRRGGVRLWRSPGGLPTHLVRTARLLVRLR